MKCDYKLKILFLMICLGFFANIHGFSQSRLDSTNIDTVNFNNNKFQGKANIRNSKNFMKLNMAPEQDCINAIPVITNYYDQKKFYVGAGNFKNEIDVNYSCLTSGEINSCWYSVNITDTGKWGFLLVPRDNNDDFDWDVYNITDNTCADIYTNSTLEVSCSFAYFPGSTGPNGGSNLNFQGQSGTPYNNFITAHPGEKYVILINNHANSPNGYELFFYGSSFSSSGNSDVNSVIPKVKLYPNPFSEKTKFIVDSYFKNGTIKIYTITGFEVKSIDFSGNIAEIDRSNLDVGIYFYQLYSGLTLISRGKFVVK